MRGGKLELVGQSCRAAPAIRDLGLAAPDYHRHAGHRRFHQVVNQPLLARLFSAGSLTGIGDLMGGDGISLENLNVPFTSKNNVISVNDARAAGPRHRRHRRRLYRPAQEPGGAERLAGAGLWPQFGAEQYSAAGRCAGVEERRGHFRRHLFGHRQCRSAQYQHQSAVGADAGHPAPDFRGPYAHRRQRAVECAARRRSRRARRRRRSPSPRIRLASPERASSCRWTASARRRC